MTAAMTLDSGLAAQIRQKEGLKFAVVDSVEWVTTRAVVSPLQSVHTVTPTFVGCFATDSTLLLATLQLRLQDLAVMCA
jgi:hypothetical protein